MTTSTDQTGLLYLTALGLAANRLASHAGKSVTAIKEELLDEARATLQLAPPPPLVGVDPAAPGGDRTVVTVNGVPIELVPVVSSNVAAVGYDEPTRALVVAFKSGGTYLYDDVPASTHADLMAAKSVGAFLAAHVKNAFRHDKLT